MGNRYLSFIALTLLTVMGANVVAQPGLFTTLRNSNLCFAAATVITNGVPGLTNPAPRLMVSAVASSSAHGGSVTLVNTQAWVQRYNGPGNDSDAAFKVVVDAVGNLVVTGYSPGQTTGLDFATVKYAADGTGIWTNRYDGPLHKGDFTRFLALDGAGNVYVSGDSEDAGRRSDVTTVKYLSDGTPVWTNRFNSFGTNLMQLIGLAVDLTGNAYIMPLDVDDPYRAFVTIKYDPSGVAVWTNRYKSASNGSDYPSAIAVDNAGCVLISGGTFQAGYNYVTVKYTPEGTGIWTNRFVYSGSELASAMTVDRSGNVIVTGDVFEAQRLYATIKYANNGTPLWTNILSGPSHQGGNVPTVVTDLGGNVFVTVSPPAANGADADYLTIKLTSDGIPLWTNRFFETNIVSPYLAGTAMDHAGNFYLAGLSRSITAANYLTTKCSADGISRWTNHYNGPSDTDDIAHDIAVGDNGNVYVTGLSSGWSSGLDFATVAYADYVLYTPPPDFIGADSFSFTAVDHLGNTGTGVVTIAVLAALPIVTTIALQDVSLLLNWSGGLSPYQVQMTTNLANPVWTPVGQPISENSLLLAPTNNAAFYRILGQ